MSLDPLGSVSFGIDLLPQGQGHRTVIAQVVSDAFGLNPASIQVDTVLDTGNDA